MQDGTRAAPEVIVFDGVTYSRDPDSEDRSKRVYYWPPRGSGRDALHREVWKSDHGPIPNGHVIHHVDHDPLNNDPANLVLMEHGDHTRHHRTEADDERDRAHLDSVRDRTAAWHRSPEGRAWHSANACQAAANRSTMKVCTVCGDRYTTSQPEKSRYCSEICQQRERRANGLAGRVTACPMCGTEFVQGYSGRPATCGRRCGQLLRKARGL